MKVTIVENDKNKTDWNNVGIGVIFCDGHNYFHNYFMKVEEIYDASENYFNAVSLATGELIVFMPDCRVKIVDAELLVKER
jgi:hypothetical protein